MPFNPRVMTERDTLEAMHAGQSIARYGDGELKIAKGADAKSQRGDPELARRLRNILAEKPRRCLVGIPNIATNDTPKVAFWSQYRDRRWTRFYSMNFDYASSFITRPDSAPWIDTPYYWQRVIDLWRDRDVVLVRGSSKSLCAADLALARGVTEIVVSRQHAWADFGALMSQLCGEKRRVLLCLGATATVLAHDLADHGVHALDLGHIGMFLRKEGRFDRESFPA
jgi:hypothetical protein